MVYAGLLRKNEHPPGEIILALAEEKEPISRRDVIEHLRVSNNRANYLLKAYGVFDSDFVFSSYWYNYYSGGKNENKPTI